MCWILNIIELVLLIMISIVDLFIGLFINRSKNSAYNQSLNNWEVSNVTNMQEMFNKSQFNQSSNNWNRTNVIKNKETVRLNQQQLLTAWVENNLGYIAQDKLDFCNADMIKFALNYFKYRVTYSNQLDATQKANLINYALQKSNAENLAMLRDWVQISLEAKNQNEEFKQEHMLGFATKFCQELTLHILK